MRAGPLYSGLSPLMMMMMMSPLMTIETSGGRRRFDVESPETIASHQYSCRSNNEIAGRYINSRNLTAVQPKIRNRDRTAHISRLPTLQIGKC